MTLTLNAADSSHVVGYIEPGQPFDQAVSIVDRVKGKGLLLRLWSTDIENDLGFEQVVLTPHDARQLAVSLVHAADSNEQRNTERDQDEAAAAASKVLAQVLDAQQVAVNRQSVLDAIDDFVSWINTEATIPETYRWSVEFGRKYAKLVMHAGPTSHGSVHAFVNLENGDLLKAAGWKAPAKGARGSVLGLGMADIKDRFDWSGRYLYKDAS